MLEHASDVLRLVVLFYAVSAVTHHAILEPLAARLVQAQASASVKETKTATLNRRKFVLSSWKLVSYMILLAFGLFAILDQQSWCWNPLTYSDPYPGGQIPGSIVRLYKVGVAHYLFSLMSMFFEPAMKDFWVMFSHHIFTLILLVSSFKYGGTKYGTVIMVLHDVADPFMELAKISLYIGREMAANVIFGMFAAIFIVTRDYIYPRHIIWNAYFLLEKNNYEFRHVTIGCLTALWFLHIFWTYLIIKVAWTAIVCEQKGDIRDKDD